MQIPTDLGERPGFIYFGADPGTNRENHAIAAPYPDTGPFTTSRLVDSARNAQGTMVGRMVGRSLDKQEMSWTAISPEVWWEMNRWFEAGHFTFYCHYFNFNLGRWETRLFYLSDVKCSPARVDPASGQPALLRDASFNVIDCGVI